MNAEECRKCGRHVPSPCHDLAGFREGGPWDYACRDIFYPSEVLPVEEAPAHPPTMEAGAATPRERLAAAIAAKDAARGRPLTEVEKLANLSHALWQSAEEEVERLEAAVYDRDQVLATIITNLKHGRTPEEIVTWYEAAPAPDPPSTRSTGSCTR